MELRPVAPSTLPRPDENITPDEARMRETAKEFEAAFLAEMLKHSGINAVPDGYGGGAGEEAFSGLLTQEYARVMAQQGGIGLAEHIFEALKLRNTGQ